MMKTLQDPPTGFDGIARAFEMARLLPSTHHAGITIGLARNGSLFASGQLDGHRQIAFFTEHLRKLGYEERLLGGKDEMFGCDMLFALPVRWDEDEPSFIRRAAVERWPARS